MHLQGFNQSFETAAFPEAAVSAAKKDTVEKPSAPIDAFSNMVDDLLKTQLQCREYFARENDPVYLSYMRKTFGSMKAARAAVKEERDRMLDLSIATEKKIKELSDHGEFQFRQ